MGDMEVHVRLPKFAITVKTYAEFRTFANAFAAKKIRLLIILGPPGTGKSRLLTHLVGADCCWIAGHAAPFGVYCLLYEYRDKPTVLDDADGFVRQREGGRLLKCLCQSDVVKIMSWISKNKAIESGDVPNTFETQSVVAIIANEWRADNVDTAALEDRGQVVVFQPSAVEVHQYAATFFWDQEVFDFIGQHLHLIDQPSLRDYIAAWELKAAGLEWKRYVLSRFLTGTTLEVARIRADSSYPDEAARVEAFKAAKLGTRSTYYNHVKKLNPPEDVPKLLLTHTKPPEEKVTEPPTVSVPEARASNRKAARGPDSPRLLDSGRAKVQKSKGNRGA